MLKKSKERLQPFDEKLLIQLAEHCISLKKNFSILTMVCKDENGTSTSESEFLHNVVTSFIVLTEFSFQTQTRIERGKDVVVKECEQLMHHFNDVEKKKILKKYLFMEESEISKMLSVIQEVHVQVYPVEFQKYCFQEN